MNSYNLGLYYVTNNDSNFNKTQSDSDIIKNKTINLNEISQNQNNINAEDDVKNVMSLMIKR